MSKINYSTRIKRIAATTLALSVIAASSSVPAEDLNDQKWRTGHVLVKFRKGVPPEQFAEILKQNRGQIKELIGTNDNNFMVITVPDRAEQAIVKALSKNPKVEFAELDLEHGLDEFPVTSPNDPHFTNSWHLTKIQAPQAWALAKSSPIIVAVLDTGVDPNHPDLKNQLLPGYNAVDGSSDTIPVHGHGTSVAGVIAAQTNNGIGVSSVAWNAKILPIKISNRTDGIANTSDMAKGLTWAISKGARVANMSYSNLSNSYAITTVAKNMRSKNGLVVVAAGNTGTNQGTANNPEVITVSATDINDAKASFSTFGPVIDVAAPGVSIFTTSRGGGYGSPSGTSFAAPVVSGAVALIMGADPKLNQAAVEYILKDTADKPKGVVDILTGHGRINVNAAMTRINYQPLTDVDTTPPTINVTSPATSSVVSGVIQATVSAVDASGINSVEFLVNGKQVGVSSIAPYQFTWDTTKFADGHAVLTAKAVDKAGNTGTSTSTVVSVKNTIVAEAAPIADTTPPTVRINGAVDGVTLLSMQSINIFSSDNVGVSKTELFINGKLVKVGVNNIFYTWNTTAIPAGLHVIEAVVRDTSNNMTRKKLTLRK